MAEHPAERETETETETETENYLDLADPEPARLVSLLKDRFGHPAFRGCQEEVVGALVRGEDVLVVMPTGAGKSLCYQLPGLVRRGCTVVVSPLIALMDDQTDHLRKLGLMAAAVHSGRDRPELRRACQAYLDGTLDFLFVSPERLRSQRFCDFLTRRTPALIAVDEAHCISQWGHDFRPDYRLLAGTLERFRSTPVVAMTATATPRVQDDIQARLGREGMRRFIHGFRRKNLGLEVVESPKSAREARVKTLLEDESLRPAIVYVPTRRLAEELSEGFREVGALAYHAGMDTGKRERVSRAFLDGESDVIVATSAFGMGIDKANVRLVVHVGLPSSVEAYYQEIGRAGRDAKPAKAVLLYSWADRRIQESLFERSYPPVELLRQVHGALGRDAVEPGALRAMVGCAEDVLDRALEQLKAHEAATFVGWPARVARGPNDKWVKPYQEQRKRRLDELEEMTSLVETAGCRMCRVVAHFGDRVGSTEPCGLCDVCAPDQSVARIFRPCDDDEKRVAQRILNALRDRRGLPKGRLYRDAGEASLCDRKTFERIVDGLVLAGLCRVEMESFQKGGDKVSYQRLLLTEEGWEVEPDMLSSLRVEAEMKTPRARGARRTPKQGGRKGRTARGANGVNRSAGEHHDDVIDLTPSGEALAEHLRTWRREEARTRGVPAYVVLPNRALEALAGARPSDNSALLAVKGVGPRFVERYGDHILTLVKGATQ